MSELFTLLITKSEVTNLSLALPHHKWEGKREATWGTSIYSLLPRINNLTNHQTLSNGKFKTPMYCIKPTAIKPEFTFSIWRDILMYYLQMSMKLTALKRCQFIGGETQTCNDWFKQMESWQGPPPDPVQHSNFSVRNLQRPYKNPFQYLTQYISFPNIYSEFLQS